MWRPTAAWSYMVVCMFDFVITPWAYSAMFILSTGSPPAEQWQPLTLQGAGLYHMAMLAILTATAHGRSQEKIANIKAGINKRLEQKIDETLTLED